MRCLALVVAVSTGCPIAGMTIVEAKPLAL
jgi:hypothetical protein